MSSSGRKPGEGAEVLGTAETDTEQGRGGKDNLRDLFKSGSTTSATVWGGDVGDIPTNREGVGLVHAWGCATDHGETAVERVGREMVLPLSDGGHEVGGI